MQTAPEQIGADVTIVENGRDAVTAFSAGAFDLVLMDIQMPEMNGIEATQAIRALEAVGGLRQLPIIALSANVMAHQVEAYAVAGMQGHVAKPIEVTKLFAAISAAVQEIDEPVAAAA